MEAHFVGNRRWWDERAPVHAAAASYQVDRLVAEPSALSQVVAFDRDRLGRLDGLDVVHLQCHVGTDTVSLGRLGASSITGYDLSPASLAEAQVLADRCHQRASWVEGNVYDAVELLGRQFDLVYTGIGALNWLPDIRRWAEVIAALLVPGGRLFLREAHPMLNTLSNARPDRQLVVEYPYFEHSEPLRFDDPGTYAAAGHVFANAESYEWNHGLGEIVQALLDSGMRLTQLVEHDSLPWVFLHGQMDSVGDGEYRISDRPNRVPHSFTLQAIRR